MSSGRKKLGAEKTKTYSFRTEPRIMKKIAQYAELHETTKSRVLNDAIKSFKPLSRYIK